MGCCEKGNDHEVDQELKRCCSTGAGAGCRRFMCLPYDDPYMIAAQIMSILAFLISWVWWVSFIISIVAMALLQLIWCFRQTKIGLLTAHVISIIAAITCLFSAIFMLVAWKKAYWCVAFLMDAAIDDDDDIYDDDIIIYVDSYQYDYCPEKVYATIAFIDAALWLASAICILLFVTSGRYAKWEDCLSSRQQQQPPPPQNPTTAVEMGNTAQPASELTTANAVVAVPETAASPVVAVAVAAASPSFAHGSPEFVVTEKVDTV